MQAWRSECEQCHVAQALKVALPLPLLCSCSSTVPGHNVKCGPRISPLQLRPAVFYAPTSYSRSNLHSQKLANIEIKLQCTLKKTKNSGINLEIEQGKRSSHKPPKHGITQQPNLIEPPSLYRDPIRDFFFSEIESRQGPISDKIVLNDSAV